LVLEREWSPNRDTVITYGITVKTRFGTKSQTVNSTCFDRPVEKYYSPTLTDENRSIEINPISMLSQPLVINIYIVS